MRERPKRKHLTVRPQILLVLGGILAAGVLLFIAMNFIARAEAAEDYIAPGQNPIPTSLYA